MSIYNALNQKQLSYLITTAWLIKTIFQAIISNEYLNVFITIHRLTNNQTFTVKLVILDKNKVNQ